MRVRPLPPPSLACCAFTILNKVAASLFFESKERSFSKSLADSFKAFSTTSSPTLSGLVALAANARARRYRIFPSKLLVFSRPSNFSTAVVQSSMQFVSDVLISLLDVCWVFDSANLRWHMARLE